MTIQKRYKEPDATWEPESLEDCIERTEGSGYWKPGTVKKLLESGQIVHTPFAEYKAVSIETLRDEFQNTGNIDARDVEQLTATP